MDALKEIKLKVTRSRGLLNDKGGIQTELGEEHSRQKAKEVQNPRDGDLLDMESWDSGR